jgi:hypothetical protein
LVAAHASAASIHEVDGEAIRQKFRERLQSAVIGSAAVDQ